MANPEHVEAVEAGAAVFNEWRRARVGIVGDLSGADLAGAHLSGMNLYRANLRGARLCLADPVPDTEDFSGDPLGAMSHFWNTEVKSAYGDLVELVRIEQGESPRVHSLPDPFIVH